MTGTAAPPRSGLPPRTIAFIVAAGVVGLPAVLSRVAGIHADSVQDAALFGVGVVAASLLLAWAGEAAEVDLGQGVALAILAFIAVLPEYAVDLVLAIKAGGNPTEYAPLAAANMTGSNRLLIGVGWSLVAFVAIRAVRKERPDAPPRLDLQRDRAVEIGFLAVATIWSLVIPLRALFGIEMLNLVDGVVFVGIFVLYLLRLRHTEDHVPNIVGIPGTIAALPRRRRRLLIGGLMLYAGIIILCAADPFAESLISVGKTKGIDEFFLIQWVAPLASESPELIIACLFALRAKGELGMGALISSKVNQWTLLVGTLPMAYTISALAHGRSSYALPLDSQQVEEFFLTSAQSLMAVAIIANLDIRRWEAGLLFVLFAVQFPFRSTEVRVVIAVIYLLIAAVILVRDRRRLPHLIRVLRRLEAAHSE